MALVNLNEVLNIAGRNSAIMAFNVTNIDMVRAVVSAVNAEKCPVVIQVFRRAFEDDLCEYLAEAVKKAAEKCDMPIVLHLDHGTSVMQVKKAVELGFSSVMIDGSQMSFEDNVNIVCKTIAIAKPHNISVEAEIGHVPMADTLEHKHNSMLADPDTALRFVKETGVDFLAVAVGSAHGFYKEKPRIRFDLLKEISEKVKIPLVLHGGTGIPDEDLKKAVTLGIKKINIASELQGLYIKEFLKEIKDSEGEFVPLDILLKPVRIKLTKFMRSKLRLFK